MNEEDVSPDVDPEGPSDEEVAEAHAELLATAQDEIEPQDEAS